MKKLTTKFVGIVRLSWQKSIKSHAEEYLMGTGLSHSKSVAIAKQGFLKKPYFSDRRLSKEDIQLLFTLRTKMLNFNSNFDKTI